MIFTATLLAAIGCLLLYKARASARMPQNIRIPTKCAALISLIGSLLVFLMAYSVLKAAFIWLGVVSLAGGITVLMAGAGLRRFSR